MVEENNQQEPTPIQEEPQAIETEPERQEGEPSSAGSFFRRALTWAAGIGVVFLLGVLVVFFLRVRPLSDQIKRLERDLGESQSKVAELQGELERLGPLEEENEELRGELSVKDRHLDLLAVLVDVTRARLALAQDQPESAQSVLQGTGATLRSLQGGLDEDQAESVRAMRDRLGLVLQELETDAFAAERDLEILTNNLVELERAVFDE